MVGCVGVAPQRNQAIGTGRSGAHGGNMDYNRIREGTTVYLPVFMPGAMLYVGDGHAAQGDGELTGSAMEVPLELEFTVDLIEGTWLDAPRAEDSNDRMAIGIAGSLDEATRLATTDLARWIEKDYGLTPDETAMVLGFGVQYDVVDLVGADVSVAARLSKRVLNMIRSGNR
jgi:acetamidase/formamidase